MNEPARLRRGVGTTDKPTSFDIAALAGVSQPTVSRALRGDRSISEATRKRVRAIADQLNYSVDHNASSLRRRRTQTLALLFFEDPTADETGINPFFLSMLGPITRAAAARGYDLLTSFQQLSADWHMAYEDSRKADGIILLGYGDFAAYQAKLDRLVAQGTHFTRWGSVREGRPYSTIGCDNVDGGLQAGRHLIAIGRRAIGFLGTADEHYPEFADRCAGLHLALKEAGLPIDPGRQVDAITTEQAGYDAAMRLMRRSVPFDALFAASDLIAIGAMRALAVAGRRVPEDVAIVGFDDIPAASLARPTLSTIAQDYVRAGERLVELLVRQVEGDRVSSEALPSRLIVRGSSHRA